MDTTLLIVLVLALVVSVIALVREVRLRRALQTLLRRLLLHWRKFKHEDADAGIDDNDRDRLGRL